MHWDLLQQARQLATLDLKKPKQANLRRAVSSTYYAIFHFLVRESVSQQMERAIARLRTVTYWDVRIPMP